MSERSNRVPLPHTAGTRRSVRCVAQHHLADLEVAKVLEAWVYWIAINTASIWLYQDRNLDIYAGLIGIYAVLSVWGLISWRRTWLAQAG